MPRYQFTYYRVIKASVRVNAENEAEAVEKFKADDESEFCIQEGRPRFVKGPIEVLWESSLRVEGAGENLSFEEEDKIDYAQFKPVEMIPLCKAKKKVLRGIINKMKAEQQKEPKVSGD